MRQKRSKPPPVPEMPTVMLTLLAPALRKSSAAAVVYGPTVDEPSALIVPPSLPSEALSSGMLLAPRATDASAATSATAEPSTESLSRRRETSFMRFSTP